MTGPGQTRFTATACRKCGQPVPDNLISCPYCAGEKNDAAVRRAQYEPLLLAAAGRAEFRVYPMPSGRHARQFFSDAAFCGIPCQASEKKRERFSYRHPGRWNELCAKCRERIEELLIEAGQAEAMKEA